MRGNGSPALIDLLNASTAFTCDISAFVALLARRVRAYGFMIGRPTVGSTRGIPPVAPRLPSSGTNTRRLSGLLSRPPTVRPHEAGLRAAAIKILATGNVPPETVGTTRGCPCSSLHDHAELLRVEGARLAAAERGWNAGDDPDSGFRVLGVEDVCEVVG